MQPISAGLLDAGVKRFGIEAELRPPMVPTGPHILEQVSSLCFLGQVSQVSIGDSIVALIPSLQKGA